MNIKQIKIIKIISIPVLLLALFIIFYLINDIGDIKPIGESSLNSSVDYYIEPGLENVAPLIKTSVENYYNFTKSESTNDRNKRLGMFFSENSPIYNEKLPAFDSSITKTTAKVNSILSSNAESEYFNYIITAHLTYYSGETLNKTEQISTSLSLIKMFDGSKLPYLIRTIE